MGNIIYNVSLCTCVCEMHCRVPSFKSKLGNTIILALVLRKVSLRFVLLLVRKEKP